MRSFREFLEGLDKVPQPVQVVVGFFFSAGIYGLFWLVALLLMNLAIGRDAVVVSSILAILCMGLASVFSFVYAIVLCVGGRGWIGVGMMVAPAFLCIITGAHC